MGQGRRAHQLLGSLAPLDRNGRSRGGPQASLNSGDVGVVLTGRGGGQAPLPHKASSAQAFLWSPLVPDGACSERPSFSLCAFKVQSSKSFERHAGAALAPGKTPCPPRVSRRPLPQKPPLPLGS